MRQVYKTYIKVGQALINDYNHLIDLKLSRGESVNSIIERRDYWQKKINRVKIKIKVYN